MCEPRPPTDTVVAVLAGKEPPELNGVDGATFRVVDTATLAGALRGADALLVWDFTARGLEAALPAADRLRWMHVSSAGVDHVLGPAVRTHPMTVTNARGVLDGALAEYVLSLLLALIKDLPATIRRQDRQQWQHRPTGRLAGRRALVVGVGGIGRAVAGLFAACGVQVDGMARTARPGNGPLGTVHASHDLVRVIGDYDTVVLAAPLTAATHNLLDRRVLAAARPGTIVINVGRGELLDQDALLDALTHGTLAGAALDVFHTEPLPSGHPLWSAPHTIISPHMSGDYRGWRTDLRALFLTNLRRFQRGQPLRNVIDKTLGYVPNEHTHPAPASEWNTRNLDRQRSSELSTPVAPGRPGRPTDYAP